MVIKAKPKILGPEYSCSDVKYLQKSPMKVPYVAVGDVIDPPPAELGMGAWGVETASE
jgi:hypothetical protein